MHGLMAGMNALGTAWIGVITVIICADILGRLLFNYPLIGVPEIVKVSVVAIVWLQMAHTLKIGGHIRSDVILDRLPPRWKALVNMMAAALGIFVFGFLVYGGWPNMIEGLADRRVRGRAAGPRPHLPGADDHDPGRGAHLLRVHRVRTAGISGWR